VGCGCAHLAHLATHGGLLLLPLGPVLVALLELRRRLHLLDHAHLVRVRLSVRVRLRVRVRVWFRLKVRARITVRVRLRLRVQAAASLCRLRSRLR